jgi:hypothetical protein
VEVNRKQAASTAQAMLDEIEPEDRTGFQASFDALPEGAKTATYSYLPVDGGGSWGAAKEDAMASFASTPEGSQLVAEWGDKAPQRVAIVKGRIGLMLQSMTAADRTKAAAWFDALPSASARAVLKALAG